MSEPATTFSPASFILGVLFMIAVQSVVRLVFYGVDAILAWRRKKREGKS